jgi:hypothetical protein
MPHASPLFSIPEARPARWTLLVELIAEWYRPVGTGDGYDKEALTDCQTRTGISLPLAMREWYASVGRMADVWNRIKGSVNEIVICPADFSYLYRHLRSGAGELELHART